MSYQAIFGSFVHSLKNQYFVEPSFMALGVIPCLIMQMEKPPLPGSMQMETVISSSKQISKSESNMGCTLPQNRNEKGGTPPKRIVPEV